MELRNIILIVIGGVIAALVLGGGAIFGIYYFQPELLGIRPPEPVVDTTEVEVPLDTIPITPSVLIDEYTLYSLEKYIPKNRELNKANDSLRLRTEVLNDTISSLRKNSRLYIDSMQKYTQFLSDSLGFITVLKDSISKINNEKADIKNDLDLAEQRIVNLNEYMQQRVDSLEQANFRTFAKMYENAEPTEVAKILERIDERDAAMILKMMQNKKAGKVLEAMMPEQAAAILLLGIE